MLVTGARKETCTGDRWTCERVCTRLGTGSRYQVAEDLHLLGVVGINGGRFR